eukprot:gene9327-1679_t
MRGYTRLSMGLDKRLYQSSFPTVAQGPLDVAGQPPPGLQPQGTLHGLLGCDLVVRRLLHFCSYTVLDQVACISAEALAHVLCLLLSGSSNSSILAVDTLAFGAVEDTLLASAAFGILPPRHVLLPHKIATSVSAKAITLACEQCNQLRPTATCDCDQLRDSALYDWCCTCPHLSLSQLKQLCLSGCALVDDGTLCSIAASCPLLDTVTVARCPLVTDVGAVALAGACSLLRKFDLEGCKAGDPLAIALAVLPLEELRCTGISDAGVLAMAKQCPDLEEVYLDGTPVTSAGLESLVTYCARLRVLHFSGCHGVSDVGVERIGQNGGDLQ